MANKQHTTNTVEINGKTYLTRHWYMDGRKTAEGDLLELDGMAAHRRYWGQMVTPACRSLVTSVFLARPGSLARILKAYIEGDEHLNECTAMSTWDTLNESSRRLVGKLKTQCEYAEFTPGYIYWSLSDNVCILKEALRLVLEDYIQAAKESDHEV